MFREGIVRVYDNRLSEAPSRTPQQSWVESRLDRILQKRRDLARCVTLCHVVLHIARALHLHRTSIAPASHAKDNVPLIKTDHDVCPSTFGLYNCNHSSKVLGSFLTCDSMRQRCDCFWLSTSPGLEMSEETLNYGDKACLKLSSCLGHDMSWLKTFRRLQLFISSV